MSERTESRYSFAREAQPTWPTAVLTPLSQNFGVILTVEPPREIDQIDEEINDEFVVEEIDESDYDDDDGFGYGYEEECAAKDEPPNFPKWGDNRFDHM